MKKGFFIIFLGAIIPWMIYLIINDKIELANFLVTTLAFGAAIYAIYNQHQESKKAEGNFREQFSLQKEVALKAEIIGAWQVLANKASGNSGKKDAIEFLASQGLSLCGIDMSEETHGGPVYLQGLFNGDFKRKYDMQGDIKFDLTGANFSGADLTNAIFVNNNIILTKVNFSNTTLHGAIFIKTHFDNIDFSKASLSGTLFSNVKFCSVVDFRKSRYFSGNIFEHCYCWFYNNALPLAPDGYKFEFEERTDENNQPIYPENNPDYRYIKLIKLK